MIKDSDIYKCEKDSIIMVWAFSRLTTQEERDEEGWDEDILDSPQTKSEWKKASHWIGENSWELMQVCDWDDKEDLCKDCQIKIKEKKSQASRPKENNKK